MVVVKEHLSVLCYSGVFLVFPLSSWFCRSGVDQENVNTLGIYFIIVHYFRSLNNTFVSQKYVRGQSYRLALLGITDLTCNTDGSRSGRLQVCLQEMTRKA